MSSTSGYMDAKYFQEFGPRLFDMSSASGYMGAKYVQEFGPRCLACHVPNVACHGVSISIVSISSVSCCVRILRVGVSMPCRGHLAGCVGRGVRLESESSSGSAGAVWESGNFEV